MIRVGRGTPELTQSLTAWLRLRGVATSTFFGYGLIKQVATRNRESPDLLDKPALRPRDDASRKGMLSKTSNSVV